MAPITANALEVLWTAAVLIMLGMLISFLSQSFISYYEYKINTRSSIEIYQEMPFPAITVCSAAMFNTYQNNISETIKNYFASGTLLGFLVSVNLSDPELEQTTMKYLLDEFTVSKDRFILHSHWSGSGNFTFQPTTTRAGICYVANNDTAHQALSTVEGRDGGLTMLLNIEEHGIISQRDMTYGASIFVHDSRDYARTVQSGVMVSPGSSVYISVKPTKYNFLPAPYKSYGNSYCEETDEAYSYEACLIDWVSTQTATSCNCTTGIEPVDVLDQHSPCSLKQFSLCYLLSYGNFEKQTLRKNFTFCPKPCSFTRYETSVSSSKFPTAAAGEQLLTYARLLGYQQADLDYVRRSLIQVTVYFDRFFMDHVVYEPQVTLDSILSFVGGQMGLFLGASFLTIAELGETLLWSFWALGRKLSKTGNKTNVIPFKK